MTVLTEQTLYDAIEHALANVIGTDDIETEVVQCVADRVAYVLEDCDGENFEDELIQTSELLNEQFEVDNWMKLT